MAQTVRREYLLRGVVQGVGFRPHVATVASRFPITGLCGNDDLQVFIEAQGDAESIESFFDEMLADLPPLARVIAVTSHDLPVVADERHFRIVASRHLPGVRTLIPPDTAACPDCLAEMTDPTNRRHHYAFITCTHCGPRLTITEDLPYDRNTTTMREFPMCPRCAAEYSDSDDRRYHAQTNSCYDCGPRLWLSTADEGQASRPNPAPASPSEQEAVIAETRRRLREGQIVAVKDLGGFHLLCNARDDRAVARLRQRKHRTDKAFAVMVPDPEAARRLAVLTGPQLALLSSPAHPILIAPTTAGYDLSHEVAPDSDDVGLLLPYTPLQTLLLETDDGAADALVATSGNLSGEPLCHENAEALQRLASIADCFLLHDRGIHVPVDDSVLIALRDGDAAPLRRSRGYAPLPVVLPPAHDDHPQEPVVLAVGGELKNTFTLAIDDMAFVSAHVGDMGSLASQQAFGTSVAQLVAMQQRQPEVVVCDLHPGYATTSWAERYVAAHPGTELLRVQHHLAHALSLLAENSVSNGPVVVAALDGTGFGPPARGTGRPSIWGCEVLVLGSRDDPTPSNWRRAWHLPEFPLAGGDRAIRHPWRIAQGLAHAWHLDISLTPASADAPEAERRLVESQLESGLGTVLTSSAGRLFDAAASMLGLCQESRYEAQAAMLLERAAAHWHPSPAELSAGPPSDIVSVLAELIAPGASSVEQRAWRFHRGFALVIAEQMTRTADEAGTRTVGLTGGAAVNRVFTAILVDALHRSGLDVLTHHVVPPNDGGLSLGQAWAARLSRSAEGDPPPACPPSGFRRVR
ncbi:carbamoyltransferase HypF [Propionibacterium sp.]|uniref:carbamoyltransferase HypF n=1 Tax=Propionibacterium sp. TaxID=1977903 RepID=UPI0039EB3A2E